MASQQELRGILRSELLARLAPLGWAVVELVGSDELLGLTRTLESRLDATVRVRKTAVAWGGFVIVSGVEVGVGYGPLRELSPLIDACGLDICSSSLLADGSLDLDVGDDEWRRVGREAEDVTDGHEQTPRPFAFQADTPGEVREIAKQLAEVVTGHGCRNAEWPTSM